MHLPFQESTIGVVVLTPASHLGEWGSNPLKAILLWFFVGMDQTLKIENFPESLGKKNWCGRIFLYGYYEPLDINTEGLDSI